jgi:putative flippase GtrA
MGTLSNFAISLLVSTALDPVFSYGIGYACSLFVAYGLNAKLIYGESFRLIRFLKFCLSYIPNFLILFTFVSVFLKLLRWHKVLVYGAAGLLGLPVTFVLVKIFAFQRKV